MWAPRQSSTLRVMYRRAFLVTSVGVLAVPLAAEAQVAGKVWHIANMSESDKSAHHMAFETAMKQLGYVEGQNLVIERRFLGGRSKRRRGRR